MASLQQYDPTVVSDSIYIVCVVYETISTVLVSDVKPPYEMTLQTTNSISTESVPGHPIYFYSISLKYKTTLSNDASNFYRVSTRPSDIRCIPTHYHEFIVREDCH